nr:hypothetical protein BaRGS_000482 [Batillaria attramentaria]
MASGVFKALSSIPQFAHKLLQDLEKQAKDVVPHLPPFLRPIFGGGGGGGRPDPDRRVVAKRIRLVPTGRQFTLIRRRNNTQTKLQDAAPRKTTTVRAEFKGPGFVNGVRGRFENANDVAGVKGDFEYARKATDVIPNREDIISNRGEIIPNRRELRVRIESRRPWKINKVKSASFPTVTSAKSRDESAFKYGNPRKISDNDVPSDDGGKGKVAEEAEDMRDDFEMNLEGSDFLVASRILSAQDHMIEPVKGRTFKLIPPLENFYVNKRETTRLVVIHKEKARVPRRRGAVVTWFKGCLRMDDVLDEFRKCDVMSAREALARRVSAELGDDASAYAIPKRGVWRE